LIPKIGKHYIILGDAKNLERKFDDIKTLYKDGMPTVGWSKYKGINMKYDGVIYGIM
jgi:cell division protein FtsQ